MKRKWLKLDNNSFILYELVLKLVPYWCHKEHFSVKLYYNTQLISLIQHPVSVCMKILYCILWRRHAIPLHRCWIAKHNNERQINSEFCFNYFVSPILFYHLYSPSPIPTVILPFGRLLSRCVQHFCMANFCNRIVDITRNGSYIHNASICLNKEVLHSASPCIQMRVCPFSAMFSLPNSHILCAPSLPYIHLEMVGFCCF